MPEHPAATTFVQRARDEYLAAYSLARDPLSRRQRPTLSMLLGDRGRARALANEIAARLVTQSESRPAGITHRGRSGIVARRARSRPRELRGGPHPGWARRGNDSPPCGGSELLTGVIPRAAKCSMSCRRRRCSAFVGHMIDAPDRSDPALSRPRSPRPWRPRFASALRVMHLPVVYTSAACGADLICGGGTRRRRRGQHRCCRSIARTSCNEVAPGGDDWSSDSAKRCPRDRGSSWRPRSVTSTTTCFRARGVALEGLCVLRAVQLETSPVTGYAGRRRRCPAASAERKHRTSAGRKTSPPRRSSICSRFASGFRPTLSRQVASLRRRMHARAIFAGRFGRRAIAGTSDP